MIFDKSENKKEADDSIKLLSVSEAFLLLNPMKEKHQYSRSVRSDVFRATLKYGEEFTKFDNTEKCNELRNFLTKLKFNETEISQLGSLCLQSVNEVKMLIPSTMRLDESVIESAILKIQELKKI